MAKVSRMSPAHGPLPHPTSVPTQCWPHPMVRIQCSRGLAIYRDSAMVSCSPSGVGVTLSSSWRCCRRPSHCWGAPQCLECRDGARTQGQQMSKLGWGKGASWGRRLAAVKARPSGPSPATPCTYYSGGFALLGWNVSPRMTDPGCQGCGHHLAGTDRTTHCQRIMFPAKPKRTCVQ